ncbi:MAG: agmatinase [Desulfomonile sp.]|nr:agmatinase [Desulfomonile sp.]
MTRHLFLEAAGVKAIPGRPALLGMPLDVTSTYRRGSADAPSAIRVSSDSIESYSPFLDRDLLDAPFADLGDVFVESSSLEETLAAIREMTALVMTASAFPLCLGGEHTIALPVVEALNEVHPDLIVVHADAHTDLREHYEGNPINHATVMRRIAEIVGPDRLIQLGIRSGTKEEFAWMRRHATILQWGPAAERDLLRRIGDRPVYLSFDLDVLDPVCFPGTGNPEPGGWFYADVERLLFALDRVHLVAADVVELNPRVDPSEVSTITAARIVRELLLILGNRP